MRVKRQLDLIESYFESFLEFRRRGESIYAVERIAQLLIESILDMGALIAAELRLKKPESYKGIASLLADALGLKEEDRKLLVELVGFRNILVHGYAEIDRDAEELVFKEMEEKLGGIVEALKAFAEKLGDPPETPSPIGEKLKPVFERYGVRYAMLFGSRAREGAGRDYDIAVSMNLRSGLELGGLLVDIAEALGVHEDLVDLVHVESAGAGIICTLLDEGIVIHGDPQQAKNHLYRRYLEHLDLATYPATRASRGERRG